MNEADVLARVRAAFAGALAPEAHDFLDDGAALGPVAAGATRVVTTDAVVEGRDFAAGLGSPADAGWRALVQNLSDLAAMGAEPRGFVWSLILPPSWWGPGLDELLAGAAEAARRYRCPLVGGDLSSTDGPLVVSVTAWGDVAGAPLDRRGARPGDGVYLSRPVGASAAGLASLRSGGAATGRAAQAHLRPEPELAFGASLVGVATACLDVSDGLSRDLYRLCRASGVRAELGDLGAALDPAAGEGDVGQARALGGGEDYALLFTAPPAQARPGWRHLGRVVEGAGVAVRVGAAWRELEETGWDHFASP